MPFLVETHALALHPREVEQIADEPLELVSLDTDGARKVAAVFLGKFLRALERFGQAAYRGQRRFEVMRNGRKKRVAQFLAFHAHQRVLSDFDEVDALESKG